MIVELTHTTLPPSEFQILRYSISHSMLPRSHDITSTVGTPLPPPLPALCTDVQYYENYK